MSRGDPDDPDGRPEGVRFHHEGKESYSIEATPPKVFNDATTGDKRFGEAVQFSLRMKHLAVKCMDSATRSCRAVLMPAQLASRNLVTNVCSEALRVALSVCRHFGVLRAPL